jgi:methionyl-tRNA formyltransferase
VKIDILISDRAHPLLKVVRTWMKERKRHDIRLISRLAQARGGDALIMVACHEIAKQGILERYRRNYVTHASDLPAGRGWSPAVWTVLSGKKFLTLSLIEAAEPVDSGRIYAKFRTSLKKNDLCKDVNEKLGNLLKRCLDVVIDSPARIARKQKGSVTYHRKRTPEDSRLNPEQSIASQFDLLRICDPDRYPAFFDLHGQRYILSLRKS